MKTRHLRLFILELVRYLISLFVFLWMQSGDSSAEFWISSHTTPLPVPPQLYGNLFRMQGRKSPPHILSPTSSDTFLVSENGVKANLDVTEMVFCCIVAWILAWQFRLPARFSVTWRWNRFRIAQNDQNNFILRQTKNRFVWPNETWCFRLVHVLLYDNFVHYLMMMSRKFGMKIYFFNW